MKKSEKIGLGLVVTVAGAMAVILGTRKQPALPPPSPPASHKFNIGDVLQLLQHVEYFGVIDIRGGQYILQSSNGGNPFALDISFVDNNPDWHLYTAPPPQPPPSHKYNTGDVLQLKTNPETFVIVYYQSPVAGGAFTQYVLQSSNGGNPFALDFTMVDNNPDWHLYTASPPPPPITARLTGHVYQSALVYPGAALSDVQVSIDGVFQTATDAAGFYAISEIPLGSHIMSFSKSGYITGTHDVNLVEGANTFDFDIAPSTVTITGQTRGGTLIDGSDSVPLAGVSISVAGGWSGTSDANGNFAIPGITYQNYAITFTKAGYVSQTQNIVMFPGSGTQMLIHMLAVVEPPQGTISFNYGTPTLDGMITDPNATAWKIQQVRVTVTNPSTYTITRNFVCFWGYQGYSGARGWGWTRPLSVTLGPGQSETLISPYSDSIDISIQAQAAGMDYWFVDDLGKASAVVHG